MEGCSAAAKERRVCGDAMRYVDRALALPPKKAVIAREGETEGPRPTVQFLTKPAACGVHLDVTAVADVNAVMQRR